MTLLWRAGALLTSIAALAAAGSTATASAGILGSCSPVANERPFLPWLDLASYGLVPNGGFEKGARGWRLTGGAAVVSGNEPYFVHASSDSFSLALPQGSSATTSAVCVDAMSPTLRFFARSLVPSSSTLKVQVVYRDLFGREETLTLGFVGAGGGWTPTPRYLIAVNLLALPVITGGTTTVAFRFTPQGNSDGWRIDDVYVDPFKGE